MNWLYFSLFFCLFGIKNSFGYFIHIDANEELCFFDRVVSGTKMGSNPENGLAFWGQTDRTTAILILSSCPWFSCHWAALPWKSRFGSV
uniref:Uncharacterized protein n=1 Tax=Meloidogyne enterolobii TaxID=390850 RepID=A0A6V7TX44_MELEN|nr:unnamed protein product [Meloidogyne enterolobii]